MLTEIAIFFIVLGVKIISSSKGFRNKYGYSSVGMIMTDVDEVVSENNLNNFRTEYHCFFIIVEVARNLKLILEYEMRCWSDTCGVREPLTFYQTLVPTILKF